MTTFVDQIINVVKISVNDTTPASSATSYTVPAGRRSVVYVQEILLGNPASGVASKITFTFGVGTAIVQGNIGNFFERWNPVSGNSGGATLSDSLALGVPMYAGDTISYSVGTGTGGTTDVELDAVVLEYSL